MRLHLLFFGILKDVLAADRETIEIADGASVGAVLRLLEARASKQGSVWRSLAVAVNQEYVSGEMVLKDGDEMALLPPVSGGRVEDCA